MKPQVVFSHRAKKLFFNKTFQRLAVDGKLKGEEEVKALMTALNDGIPPCDEDVTFVFEHVKEGTEPEVLTAVTNWYKKTYSHIRKLNQPPKVSKRLTHAVLRTVDPTEDSAECEIDKMEREAVHNTFLKYSKGTNGVEKSEVRQMMMDLNENIVPSDEEVDLVMETCDLTRDGVLHEDEFVHAITIWYLELEDIARRNAAEAVNPKSKCCCLQ
eukprot:PhF_6_TR41706/c0_g1_i1/m.63271